MSYVGCPLLCVLQPFSAGLPSARTSLCVLDYLDCGDLVKDFWHSQPSWVVIGEQFKAVMYHKCVLYFMLGAQKLNIGPLL